MVDEKRDIMTEFSNHYFVDFETTSVQNYLIENEVRVFMWRVENIYGDGRNGHDIKGFLRHIRSMSKGREIVVWFHNLKFDFTFIEWFIQYANVAWLKPGLRSYHKKNSQGGEYKTIRDEMGNLYGAEWLTQKESVVSFRDSAKIFPMPLSKLGEMVHVEKLEDDFDYEIYRPKKYNPSAKELKYLEHDVKILRLAMTKHFERYDTVRMTRSSYAFSDLKRSFVTNYNKDKTPDKMDTNIFDKIFPPSEPELYADMQKAYAGGIVYVNPEHRGKVIEKVRVYDVNSLYPGAMQRYHYPYGEHIDFEGSYIDQPESVREEFPLYIQHFRGNFTLKEGGFPMLPKKLSKEMKAIYNSEQIKGSGMISLCNPDFEHFVKNYEIESIEFLGGFMFRSIFAPFKDYIDEESENKIQAELSGDMIGRTMSKLNMNGCYGKFAQSPFRGSKLAHLDEAEILRYREHDEEPESKNYFPMGIFITAYARDILLKGIYAAGVDRVLYVDTDSIHLKGWEEPKNLPVHRTKLGFWGPDGGIKEDGQDSGKYHRGKFLRDKFYAEMFIDENGKERLKVTGAGISDEARGKVKNLDEFMLGIYYDGNLTAKQVKGGTLLIRQDKYVKPDRSIASADEIMRDDEHNDTERERSKQRQQELQEEVDRLREELTSKGYM